VQYDQDTQLMLKFQRGDNISFDILFRKYSVSLINFVYRFLGSRTKAEEVAQEVLLKIYLARKSYHPKAKFSTWVYKIATNSCLNELRKHEYRQPPISFDNPGREDADWQAQWTDHQTPTPDQDLERKLFEEAFNGAVSALPGRQRAAFLLHRFNNATYKDVALSLECSEASVKSLIHRATETLKKKLKDYIT
jgi:RNA polymerase sigma-70 factor (ECF subfamily)